MFPSAKSSEEEEKEEEEEEEEEEKEDLRWMSVGKWRWEFLYL
jgi:hypothetical protein